jgi:hypothetical protein
LLSWQAGTREHPFRRYTFRFEHFARTSQPTAKETLLRSVTAGGEHKAAAMGAAALLHRLGDIVMYTVELVDVEAYYEFDPANDIIDYHEAK